MAVLAGTAHFAKRLLHGVDVLGLGGRGKRRRALLEHLYRGGEARRISPDFRQRARLARLGTRTFREPLLLIDRSFLHGVRGLLQRREIGAARIALIAYGLERIAEPFLVHVARLLRFRGRRGLHRARDHGRADDE